MMRYVSLKKYMKLDMRGGNNEKVVITYCIDYASWLFK